jgi:hypothetical protein
MTWRSSVVKFTQLSQDLREGDHLEELGVDGKIILNWIFKKWDGAVD